MYRHLANQDEELDRTAEVDSVQFWKIVNSRKKGHSVLIFDIVVRDRNEFTKQ